MFEVNVKNMMEEWRRGGGEEGRRRRRGPARVWGSDFQNLTLMDPKTPFLRL